MLMKTFRGRTAWYFLVLLACILPRINPTRVSVLGVRVVFITSYLFSACMAESAAVEVLLNSPQLFRDSSLSLSPNPHPHGDSEGAVADDTEYRHFKRVRPYITAISY